MGLSCHCQQLASKGLLLQGRDIDMYARDLTAHASLIREALVAEAVRVSRTWMQPAAPYRFLERVGVPPRKNPFQGASRTATVPFGICCYQPKQGKTHPVSKASLRTTLSFALPGMGEQVTKGVPMVVRSLELVPPFRSKQTIDWT